LNFRTGLEVAQTGLNGRHHRQDESGRMAEFAVSPHAEGGRLSYNNRLDGINFTWEKSTIAAGLRRMLERNPQVGDPNFAFQSIGIAEMLPGLEREVSSPFLPPTVPAAIWIGSQVVVPAHFDEASNLAFVASGRRRFTLFPPAQVGNLYIGRLDFTPAGHPVSRVDPRAPDLDRFPRFTGMVHAIQALRHLPPGERDAWKAFMDHYVFETNGDPAEHLAGVDAGILGPKSPALSEHIHKYLLDRMQRTVRR